MKSKIPILFLFISSQFILYSCDTKETHPQEEVVFESVDEPKKSTHTVSHQYGGWYCPDNIFGFPAVDVMNLDEVPVVNDRLPTKEETRNGTSLMYFDTDKYPKAHPLDMRFPRLARYYSNNTKKNELVVVIQAVVVETDTVVGFRYVNGGNGSSWFDEVTFLSDNEVKNLKSTPFVSVDTEIKSSKSKIWEVITSPKYSKTLGEVFDKNAFVESEWRTGSEVYFKYEPDSVVNTGMITIAWEETYIQIDYNMEGYHYVEKFLLSENENGTQLNVVAGPYEADYMTQKAVWKNWIQKVKELSENDQLFNLIK